MKHRDKYKNTAWKFGVWGQLILVVILGVVALSLTEPLPDKIQTETPKEYKRG